MIYQRDFKRNFNFGEHIDIEDFKNYPLSIDSELTDKQIKILLETAGLLIQKVITRPIFLTPIVDRVPGTDTFNLMVRYPINSLSKVLKLYGTSSTEVSETYMKLHNISFDQSPLYKGEIERLDSLWDSECLYEVQYTTGDVVFPLEIKHATILTAANLINSSEKAGIKSVKIADLQVSYAQNETTIPPEALELLSDWISRQYVV